MSNWLSYRESLKRHVEAEIHPHVSAERASEFRSGSFESTEVEYLDLLYAAIRTKKPRQVVETGSNVGISSVCIALALKENKTDGGPVGLLTSLEKDQAANAEAYELAKTWHVSEFVNFICADSIEYLSGSEVHGKSYQVGFFDSTRVKRGEEAKIAIGRGLFEIGALLIFHDTSALRGQSLPSQVESQSFYIRELESVERKCSGKIIFPLSRGMHIYQL
jgi:predicted O-methyltransferase YrrM